MVKDNIIGIVIPCYKVRKQIIKLISQIPIFCDKIYAIDDCCPENSGKLVESVYKQNEKIKVFYNNKNVGVGGSVIVGYKEAIKDKCNIVIKLDGDGQMKPELIPIFIEPILANRADYTKGNRFYSIENIQKMPFIRILGNLFLSFLSKMSTGYWDVFDPTNGYTAIYGKVLEKISFGKLSKRYFFETDMLFRLNTIRAKVVDIPMYAVYGNEKSSLKIPQIFFSFTYKHLKNIFKRVVYSYFIREFSLASLELLFGTIFFSFGIYWGIKQWNISHSLNIATSTGNVMISVLPIILGFQLLLSFLSYDISLTPKNIINGLRITKSKKIYNKK